MSIYQYDLVHKKDSFQPELIVVRELNDIDYNEEFDEHKAIILLNKEFGLKKYDSEHNYIIGFNDNYIVGIYLLALGDCNGVLSSNRNLGIFLLLSGATRFSSYHNHPNGNISESVTDRLYDHDLNELGKLLEIEYSGSYIITTESWHKIGTNIEHPYSWEEYNL